MTTSRGPFEEDVFFVLSIPLGEGQDLRPRLQQFPGFDSETFIHATGVSEEGISVRWRR